MPLPGFLYSQTDSRKNLNHCSTGVNITANRLEAPAVGDSLYNGFSSSD